MMRTGRISLRGPCCALLLLVICSAAAAQPAYQTADEAYQAGMRLLRQRKAAESRAPLEAALAMAPDDAFRLKVYRALFAAYRGLKEAEPMRTAAEFIIRHAEAPLDRTSTTHSLVSFLYQRGKVDDAIDHYERLLAEDPDDMAALSVLVEIYMRVRPNAARAAELKPRLLARQREAARRRAEKFERQAASTPLTATALWKDAAVSWIAAGDEERALAAARQAEDLGPDERSQLLAHFWHRSLGEVYLEAGEPRRAIPHFKAAIATTDIAGYLEECRELLARAEAMLADKP